MADSLLALKYAQKETLVQVQGKFLLSYNDCDYIRKLYKKYNMKQLVDLTIYIPGLKAKIMNTKN